MKEYTVISKQVTLHTGIVKLTVSQAKDRIHNLAMVEGEDGLYTIINPVNFKNGEVFSYNGEVNKAMLEEIGEVVDVKEKKASSKPVKKEEHKKVESKKETPGK